jgi:hypothetical protein
MQPVGAILSDKFISTKREKTWDECGIEEKVERVRRAMRDQRYMVDSTFRLVSAASETVHAHQHNNVTGEVLKPANRYDGLAGPEGSARSFDPLA